MKEHPTLYRKRLIPQECVLLKNDHILECDDTIIVTSWNTIKPRHDLHHGYSCYFLKEGIKVSKFYAGDGTFLYWYCDIVSYEPHPEDNSLIVTDLLADVLVYPNGFVKVVDIDELVLCHDNNMITTDQLKESLTRLDHLLRLIYADKFDTLTFHIEQHEKNGCP